MRSSRVFGALFFALGAAAFASANADVSSVPGANVRETVAARSAYDGLNPKALIALVKEMRDAASLEQELNTEGSINNLDLNEDGQPDVLKVVEEKSSGTTREIAIYALVSEDETQEVARIRIEREESRQDHVNVVIVGNPALYGPYAHYSWYGLYSRDYMFFEYLFGVHVVYVSPWYYGYYPSYWHSYTIRPWHTYRSWVGRRTYDCPRPRYGRHDDYRQSRQWGNASRTNAYSRNRSDARSHAGVQSQGGGRPSYSRSERQTLHERSLRSQSPLQLRPSVQKESRTRDAVRAHAPQVRSNDQRMRGNAPRFASPQAFPRRESVSPRRAESQPRTFSSRQSAQRLAPSAGSARSGARPAPQRSTPRSTVSRQADRSR